MTKKILAMFPSSRTPRMDSTRLASAAAVLVLVLASLLTGSAMPRAEMAVESTPIAAAPQSGGGEIAPSSRPTMDMAARHEREIEALSANVARRYRVATEASRGLVALAYRAGARSGLDPLLILAVIAVESRFNPIAQSDGGALGLMQVIPHYHKDKMDSADSVLDPETNIQLGARVLKDYIRRGGTEVAGLQLYNGSSGDPDNGYAQRVLAEKQRLRETLRHERERNHV